MAVTTLDRRIAKALWMIAENDGRASSMMLMVDEVTMLLGKVKIQRSEDCYSYLIWHYRDDQARPFLKVAPTFNCNSEDDYLAILEHQSWVCI